MASHVSLKSTPREDRDSDLSISRPTISSVMGKWCSPSTTVRGPAIRQPFSGRWQNNAPKPCSSLSVNMPCGIRRSLKQVAAEGHTIGSHTWSHADLSKLTTDQGKEEIEKGVSAVRVALGQPEASFFRFPALRHSPELLTYLSARNIGIFSTDMDSFDFKMRKSEQIIELVVSKLKKHGKGIVLMHDFQHATSLALPELLVQLKTSGYKVVQVKAKEPVQTLAEYDQQLEKELGGGTANSRPILSVVRTISE